MQLEFINKINNYSNPYIAFAMAFQDETNYQGPAFIELVKFLTNSSKDNINEKFFTIRSEGETINDKYFNCYEIKHQNIGDILSKVLYEKISDWDIGKPQEIFNLLEKTGFNFTKDISVWKIKQDELEIFSNSINNQSDLVNFLNKHAIKQGKENSIFNIPYYHTNENKIICLLSHAYSQTFPEDFVTKVAEYNTLHMAVKKQMYNLIDFLIEKCDVSPNIKNEKNDIPLFYCDNLDVLKYLEKYQLDWLHKNNLDKDCISVFTGLEDKHISTKMVNYSQVQLANLLSVNPTLNISHNYLNERIRKSLLDMVLADRTKKDLESYIEANNVTTVSDIFDEKGNSLAQICLRKNNWSRYNVFKDAYPLDHVNNDNIGSLEIILSAKRVTYEERAKPILDELLNAGVQFKNVNFSFNLLNEYLNNSYSLDLPQWYMKLESKKRDRFIPFATALVGPNYAQKFDDEYFIDSTYTSSTKKEDAIKKSDAVAYLLLTHTALYNKDVKFDIFIDDIFNEKDKRYNVYSIDDTKLNNFMSIINVIDRNEHLHILDYSQVWNNFEQKALEFIIKTYHNYKDNISTFIHMNKSVMNILIDRKSDMFASIVNDEFIHKISIDKELSVKLEYVLLSKEVTSNEANKIKKTIKI